MTRSRAILGIPSVVLAAALAIVPRPYHHGADAGGTPPESSRPPPANPQAALSSSGVTEPKSKTLKIVSETPGAIRAVLVQSGEHVRAGQVLVELNHDVQQAGVEAAKAALGRAVAQLERLRNWDRPEERAIARAQLDEAEAQLRSAEQEVARLRQMLAHDSASGKELADAENALQAARARCDAARERWKLSEAGARSEDVNSAMAAVEEAEARYDAARYLLEKCYIRSPIDGMVIYRYFEPGEFVHPESPTPILTVGDRSTLYVRVDVDELDIARVSVGQPVVATAPAFGETKFTGRVVRIEPTLGRKNFRTSRPGERLDSKVQEVVVALDGGAELPLELQMVVWFLDAPSAHQEVTK